MTEDPYADLARDEAIRRAAQSTQPEVALVIDGYCIVKSATLAQHEYNLGELIQLRHKHAALLEERRVLLEVRDAAQAVQDVADYWTDETETQPLWDDIPVELADRLVVLRAALSGAAQEQGETG
jgi:hypothetical protein